MKALTSTDQRALLWLSLQSGLFPVSVATVRVQYHIFILHDIVFLCLTFVCMAINYQIVTELCWNISHGCFGLFLNPAIPRRNEIHDLMNIHEQFMNIHELFMNGNHIWFMN